MQALLTAVGRPVHSLESFGRGGQVSNAAGWCHGFTLALEATTAAAATSTAPATALAITSLATMAIALDAGLSALGKAFTVVLAVRARVTVTVAEFSRTLLACGNGLCARVVALFRAWTTVAITSAATAPAAPIAAITILRCRPTLR